MSKEKPATQWHPLFAELLRPLLQNHFDVQTNVPVGDTPRQADILLLRRTSNAPTPFRGLWRHLTTWNIVEFKGPTVSARVRDLDLLVELGLGIDRRLNEERQCHGQAPLAAEEVSFWYLVKSIGRRYLPEARLRLGQFHELATGLWRGEVLQRLVFLVSSDALPSDPESVPMHLLVRRSPEQELELARLVVEEPNYLGWYSTVLSTMHPEVWKEVRKMARARGKELQLDFSALIEDIGMEKLVETLGVDEVIDAVGVETALKRFGVKKVIETVGPDKVIEEMGIDWLVSHLRPAQLKKLKDRLK